MFQKIIRAAIYLLVLSISFFSSCVYAKTVGISMPSVSFPRYNIDVESLQDNLHNLGFETKLSFASRSVEQQIKDIEKLIASDCDVLVITAVDGAALSDVLEKAKQKNIKIIAYDVLIMDSNAVDYYITFDSYQIGKLQGQFIEEKLHLNKHNTPEQYIEFFAGDKKDHNTQLFWDGAMDVLKHYLDDKSLECASGEIELKRVFTEKWNKSQTKERMARIYNEYYSKEKTPGIHLGAVLCPSDDIAISVAEVLHNEEKVSKKDFPIITGQDCSEKAIKYIKKGYLSMSIFKDAKYLGYKTSQMINQIFSSENVEVNDTTSFNNGKKVVPTIMCSPMVVTIKNLREILFDSGYYNSNILN